MKYFAIIAALAFAMPGLAEARDHHSGHSHHGGHYYHGHSSYRYPSYGYRSYSYPRYYSYSSYPRYYSGYYGGYYPYSYGSYYGGYYPSVSLTYSSVPRTYAQPYYDSTAGSLEVDVQRALKRRGYYSGAIDGDIGPGSRNAIRSYQADRGLAVTGRIDSALLRSLGI